MPNMLTLRPICINKRFLVVAHFVLGIVHLTKHKVISMIPIYGQLTGFYRVRSIVIVGNYQASLVLATSRICDLSRRV
ncbi:protein of unknown function [Candidatus Methylomirabilis oxygeniifera]|uniref:Uncharacterized protein n=1 Tax=Methylomirabilis oxygeniifera TaxID=671143 RepID=D5MEQ6_METO1|nr:protein of unknown function [Candidatus Methylomirabilis oxyfera]